MSHSNPAPDVPIHQPGTFYPTFDSASAAVVKPRRRRFDISAAGTLLLGLPWMVLSLFVVACLSLLAGERWTIWIVLGWALSGVVVAIPATEDLLARAMLRMRKPTLSERQRFTGAWTAVLQAAEIPEKRFRLWVQDSDEVNAFAAGGHVVAVTRWAVESLHPRQLEAVLAHELGHHLGGHAWVSLVTYWYSIPARMLWSAIRTVIRATLVVLSIFSAVGYLLGLLFVGFICLMYFGAAANTQSVFAKFVMLGPILAPIAVAYFSRRGELKADKTAASLGYGHDLIVVLRQWQAEGHDDAIRAMSGFRRLFATHPETTTRIRAVEAHLNRTGQ